MHVPVAAISNQQSAINAKPSSLRQSALSLASAVALTFSTLAVSSPAAAQPVLAPVVKASSPLPAASGTPLVRPSKRARTLGALTFETAQRSTALCADIGDPACSGDPEGWSKFWTLNFRFAFQPDTPPELEKVTVYGTRSTCYIWMTGVSGEDIQVVLPTCGLGDAMGIPEISTLSPGEFQALEAEVERLARVVQKCVRAQGSRANDTSELWSRSAANTQLAGIPVGPGDVMVVRYASGEIYAFDFGGRLLGNVFELANPRLANVEERAVCVVAG